MKKTIKLLTRLVLLIVIIGCSTDDAQNINPTPSLTKQQLQGTWKVTYFNDQVDKTSDYSGYLFYFDQEGEIEVDVDGISSSGAWFLFQDQDANQEYTIIDAVFDQGSSSTTVNDRLRELTEEWIVKKVLNNATKIELEERISNNPPEILHLEKVQIQS